MAESWVYRLSMRSVCVPFPTPGAPMRSNRTARERDCILSMARERVERENEILCWRIECILEAAVSFLGATVGYRCILKVGERGIEREEKRREERTAVF